MAKDSISRNHDDDIHHPYYAIRICEHLDLRWSDWFDGLTLTHTDSGDTMLAGLVADQAALHGLLAKVRDLNLTLISVNRIEPRELSEDQGS
ncbi:MAG: hypothetical protein HZB51_32025 [Chloroflexi bacterium]|nr:hypothetical protein [Chloroflexota bacterium]